MRLSIRIFVLLLSAVLAFQVIPCVVEQRIESCSLGYDGNDLISGDPETGRSLALMLPALSPLVAIASVVAVKAVGWVFLLGFPVLIAGVFKGRWFCFNLCPTGFVSELAGRMRSGSKSRFSAWPRLGGVLVLLIIGGALFGYPLFLWMDPLRIFNAFFSSWHSPLTFISMLPASGLALIIFLSIWRPNAWCYRICPLGAVLESLGKIRRRILLREQPSAAPVVTGSKSEYGVGRRRFLSVLAGGLSGFAARMMLTVANPPIRPPGAVDEDKFTAVCVRCGNCIRACPKRIILPDMGESGVAGFMTPLLKMESQYCVEWCHECSKVCPTGAIARLTLREKNDVCIGVARIKKSLCLAWERSQACMVCNEYCPYRAITLVMTENGVPSPVVDEQVCRGCGYCQVGCPAEEKAIVVKGGRQKRLAHVEIHKV